MSRSKNLAESTSTATFVFGANLSRNTGDVFVPASVGADPRIGMFVAAASFSIPGRRRKSPGNWTVAQGFAGGEFACRLDIDVIVLQFQNRRIEKSGNGERVVHVRPTKYPRSRLRLIALRPILAAAWLTGFCAASRVRTWSSVREVLRVTSRPTMVTEFRIEKTIRAASGST